MGIQILVMSKAHGHTNIDELLKYLSPIPYIIGTADGFKANTYKWILGKDFNCALVPNEANIKLIQDGNALLKL